MSIAFPNPFSNPFQQPKKSTLDLRPESDEQSITTLDLRPELEEESFKVNYNKPELPPPSPNWYDKPFLPPVDSSSISPGETVESGIPGLRIPTKLGAEAYNLTVPGITTPKNLGLIGASIIPGPQQPAVSAGVGTYFFQDMARHMPEEATALYQNIKEKGITHPDTLRLGAQMGLTTAMILGIGKHLRENPIVQKGVIGQTIPKMPQSPMYFGEQETTGNYNPAFPQEPILTTKETTNYPTSSYFEPVGGGKPTAYPFPEFLAEKFKSKTTPNDYALNMPINPWNKEQSPEEMSLNEPIPGSLQRFDALKMLDDQNTLAATKELEARRGHVWDVPERMPQEDLPMGMGGEATPEQVMAMRDRFFPESARPNPLLERRAFPREETPSELGNIELQSSPTEEFLPGEEPIYSMTGRIPRGPGFPKVEEEARTGEGLIAESIIDFPPGGKSKKLGELVDDAIKYHDEKNYELSEIAMQQVIAKLQSEQNPKKIGDNYNLLMDYYYTSRNYYPHLSPKIQILLSTAMEKMAGLSYRDIFPDKFKAFDEKKKAERLEAARQKLDTRTEAEKAREGFEIIRGGKEDPDITEAKKDKPPYGTSQDLIDAYVAWDRVLGDDLAILEKSGLTIEELGYNPIMIKALSDYVRKIDTMEVNPDNYGLQMARREFIQSFGDNWKAAKIALTKLDTQMKYPRGNDYDYFPEILEANDKLVEGTRYLKALEGLKRGKLTENATIDDLNRMQVVESENVKREESAVKQIFENMVKVEDKNWHILDRYGLLTPDEIAEIGNNRTLNIVMQHITGMWRELSQIEGSRTLGDIREIGIVFDPNVRGLNVRHLEARDQFALFINPFTIWDRTNRPKIAGSETTMLGVHEFVHNIVRAENTDAYNSAVITTMGNWTAERYAYVANQIETAIRDTRNPDGYSTEVQRLLQIGNGAIRRSRSRTPIESDAQHGNILTTRDISAATKDTKGNGKRVSPGVAIGGKVTLKRGVAKVSDVKQLTEAGFEYESQDAQGNLIFRRISKSGPKQVLEEDVGLLRPTPSGAANPPNIPGGTGRGPIPPRPPQGPSTSGPIGKPPSPEQWWGVEAFNLRRALLSSWDFSAAFRQAFGLIHKPQFWKAFGKQFSYWKSKENFDVGMQAILNKPLFKKRVGINNKILPSFAEEAGLKLTEFGDLANREEAFMSSWAESGKFLEMMGLDKTAEFYRATVGQFVGRSNRAYVGMLNELRATVFEDLIAKSKVLENTPNLTRARAIAEFVNNATGRGSLKVGAIKFGQQSWIPSALKGKTITPEINLEQSAVLLNSTLFAPRLIASRLRVLNPAYYIFQDKFVRMEALKSLAAMTIAGTTVASLAKLAGADVSFDPSSSDFLKARFGRTRIDPWGGFQQYGVAFYRFISGEVASSKYPGVHYDVNNPRTPFEPTRASVLGRFARGKLHPEVAFAIALLNNQTEMTGEKMNFTTMNPIENSMIQRFIPIIVQDLYELSKTDPELLPIAGPLAAFGMGVQTYYDQNNQGTQNR